MYVGEHVWIVINIKNGKVHETLREKMHQVNDVAFYALVIAW